MRSDFASPGALRQAANLALLAKCGSRPAARISSLRACQEITWTIYDFLSQDALILCHRIV